MQSFLAKLHNCYIVIYTDDEIYIINDERVNKTKQFYNQLNEVIKHDY